MRSDASRSRCVSPSQCEQRLSSPTKPRHTLSTNPCCTWGCCLQTRRLGCDFCDGPTEPPLSSSFPLLLSSSSPSPQPLLLFRPPFRVMILPQRSAKNYTNFREQLSKIWAIRTDFTYRFALNGIFEFTLFQSIDIFSLVQFWFLPKISAEMFQIWPAWCQHKWFVVFYLLLRYCRDFHLVPARLPRHNSSRSVRFYDSLIIRRFPTYLFHPYQVIVFSRCVVRQILGNSFVHFTLFCPPIAIENMNSHAEKTTVCVCEAVN